MSNPLTLIIKSAIALAASAPRGSWWWAPVYGLAEQPRSTAVASVLLSCAECGATFRLRDATEAGPREDGTFGHDIDPEGVVSPSIVCPKKCGWHVWGKLDQWANPVPAVDVIEVQGEPVQVVATIQPMDVSLEPDLSTLEAAVATTGQRVPVPVWHGLIKCTVCGTEARLAKIISPTFDPTLPYQCQACGSLAHEVLG